MTLFTNPRSQSPLHHWHVAHGARLVEANGWQVPAVYSSTDREIAAARAGVALADISSWAKRSLHGRGVAEVVRAVCPDSAATKPRGVAVLGGQPPVLACRLTEEHLLLLASTPDENALGGRIRECSESAVETDATAAYAGFWLVGPRTEEVFRRLTSLDVSSANFPVGYCVETALAGVHGVLVRTAELALPAVRIYVAWDLAEYVWEAVWHAGRQLGVAPLGLDSLHALRASAQHG